MYNAMKLESLKSPAFAPMTAGTMARVLGGTPTAGYQVSLPSREEFRCASDCTEIDENGDYYAEFYDAHGCLITTFRHKN